MSRPTARIASLVILVVIALVGETPQSAWAGDDAEFPRVSMAMQCQMGGDTGCLKLCGSEEDYDQDACVAAFNKFRKSKREPATTEAEAKAVEANADGELAGELAYYERECMRHTASVSDLLNQANPDGPQRENTLRTHYHYAKDDSNPLDKRKEAMKSALETCETMKTIQGG